MSTVQNLVDAVYPRLRLIDPQFSFVQGVNEITQVLFDELVSREENIVKAPFSLTFNDTDPSSKALPADFRGFDGKPYISGQTNHLEPFDPSLRADYDGKTCTTPEYYEILGTTLYLRKAPEAEVTAKGMYYKWPGTVSALSDTMPFGGIFDVAYREGIIRLNELGLAFALDPAFQAFLFSHLEPTLRGFHSKKPQRRQVRDL